jgi:hypothetical protein
MLASPSLDSASSAASTIASVPDSYFCDPKIRVYIAGPYTLGDPIVNTRRAMDAYDKLIDRGMAPYCPHVTMFHHLIRHRDPQEWIGIDLEWLRVCDIVLRLPGESAGADVEVAFANDLNIPVIFGDLNEVCRLAQQMQTQRGEADGSMV